MNNNGSAFPCQPANALGEYIGPLEYGLSIRQYRAVHILAGIMANPELVYLSHDASAEKAYLLADALEEFEERERNRNKAEDA